jgi:hypothetical protein
MVSRWSALRHLVDLAGLPDIAVDRMRPSTDLPRLESGVVAASQDCAGEVSESGSLHPTPSSASRSTDAVLDSFRVR